MARDRQRAKQRQAQRREARLAARRAGTGPAPTDGGAAEQPTRDALGRPLDEPGGPLAGGADAPPENVGRSDTVAETPPPAPILDGDPDREEPEFDEEPEGFDEELDDEAISSASDLGDGGRRGRPPGGGELAVPGASIPEPRPRPTARLVTFLQGSWRELQRVQWPDRRQVLQATGVVIGFVIVAGVFLGVADWAATKIVNYILK